MGFRYDRDKLIQDVREFMDTNNLSMRRFSKMCDIDPAVMSRILNKKYYGSDNNLASICSVIDKSAGLYTDERIVIKYIAKDVVIDRKDVNKMSIEELTVQINWMKEIRKRKIEEEIELKMKEIQMYKNLLDEEDET